MYSLLSDKISKQISLNHRFENFKYWNVFLCNDNTGVLPGGIDFKIVIKIFKLIN